MTDPCCNGYDYLKYCIDSLTSPISYLSWNSSQCASRQVETALSVFDGAADQINERCGSPACTTLFLQDYMTALGTKADSIDACSTQTADVSSVQAKDPIVQG